MRLKIRVTAQDIHDGEQALGATCALALAAKRVDSRIFEVGHRSLTLRHGHGAWDIVPLSRRARAFVRLFDRNKSACEPATFVVTV